MDVKFLCKVKEISEELNVVLENKWGLREEIAKRF